MKAWHGFLAFFFLLALGCGGGGAGVVNPTLSALTGQVLWIETGAAPNPAATVQVGSASTLTDLSDGFFSLDVPNGTASLTVNSTQGGSPIVRTFDFAAILGDTDLGDLYIGPEVVTLRGKVLDSSSSAPVVGATVRIAGRSGTTDANGDFAVSGVAYSGSALAVFLGLQGTVNATGYFQGFFSPPSAASGGFVDVGTVSLVSTGSNVPPGLPFNLSGTVSPGGGGASVSAMQGSATIRTVTADVTGRYEMWLPAGTYDIVATKGAATGQSQVTVVSVNQSVTGNVTLN